jgi:hypothetical protein
MLLTSTFAVSWTSSHFLKREASCLDASIAAVAGMIVESAARLYADSSRTSAVPMRGEQLHDAPDVLLELTITSSAVAILEGVARRQRMDLTKLVARILASAEIAARAVKPLPAERPRYVPRRWRTAHDVDVRAAAQPNGATLTAALMGDPSHRTSTSASAAGRQTGFGS